MRDDVTNPGAAPGEPSVVAEDADDEFPSEATRIDSGGFNGGGAAARPAPVRAAGSLESLVAPRSKTGPVPSSPPVKPASGAPNSGKNKLAALQSLSLDGGGTGSTRLPPAPRQHGGSKLPWVILVLIGLGYGGNVAWQKYRKPVEPTGPAIRTETVQQTGGAGQTHTASGFVAAQTPISVGAASGGLVKEVKVANNDNVTKNQIIVNLDSSAAEAELAAIYAEIREDQNQLKMTEKLFNAGAATGVDVAKARGVLAIARAKVSSPEQKIRQSHVRTFTAGTVLEVLVHPGETVAPNGPVVKIADLHSLNAEVDINEADLPKIHRNQQVEVTSETFPDKTFKGTVIEIGEQADKSRGTVLVKVALVVQENTLRPGMSVKCTFMPVQGEKPRIYISHTAISPPSSVFVVGSDKRVTKRTISIGPTQGSQVEVLSGLKSGDEIVSDATTVQDGQVLPQPPPQ